MTKASGLLIGVGAAALFGTSGPFASALMDAGWSPAAASTARISLAALLLTPSALLALRGRWHVLRAARRTIVAFGVVAIAVAQLCYFSAVERLSVSVALLLEYSAVVLVVLWAWLVRGRRPTPRTLAGAVVAVAGLVLVLDVFGGAQFSLLGVAFGFAAAVGLAAYFVLSEDADDAVPPLVVAWGGMVVGAVLLWVLGTSGVVELRASFTDVAFAGRDVSWWVPVAGLSVLAGALAYLCGIASTRMLGVTVASFLGLLEVLFAALFAWILVDQQPTTMQAVGGLVVLAGLVLVRAGELRSVDWSTDGVGLPVPALAVSDT